MSELAHYIVVHDYDYIGESHDDAVAQKRIQECIESLDKQFDKIQNDALEEAAQWAEQQTGDFQQFFTPEKVAAVLRAKKRRTP